MTLLLTFWLAGCSVNQFGLVDVRKVQMTSGVAYALSAFGVHLNTLDDAPSLTLGHYEAHYFFAENCIADMGDSLSALNPPQAIWRRVGGLQLSAGAGEIGVMLGYREQLLAARIPAEASIYRVVTIDTINPEASLVVYHGDCW